MPLASKQNQIFLNTQHVEYNNATGTSDNALIQNQKESPNL